MQWEAWPVHLRLCPSRAQTTSVRLKLLVSQGCGVSSEALPSLLPSQGAARVQWGVCRMLWWQARRPVLVLTASPAEVACPFCSLGFPMSAFRAHPRPSLVLLGLGENHAQFTGARPPLCVLTLPATSSALSPPCWSGAPRTPPPPRVPGYSGASDPWTSGGIQRVLRPSCLPPSLFWSLPQTQERLVSLLWVAGSSPSLSTACDKTSVP